MFRKAQVVVCCGFRKPIRAGSANSVTLRSAIRAAAMIFFDHDFVDQGGLQPNRKAQRMIEQAGELLESDRPAMQQGMNDGKEWSDADIADLRDNAADAASPEETTPLRAARTPSCRAAGKEAQPDWYRGGLDDRYHESGGHGTGD
jgi:hypothetical protein